MTRGGAALVFAVTMALAGTASAASCVRIVRPLAAFAAPVAADLEPATCLAAMASPVFRYDLESRVARTTRALSEGEIVPALPAFALPAVRPGDRLLVHAQAGPVIVEREVEALQAARPGQRLFVRASDGKVFSVPLAEAQP